jgi:hypothetical protein
MQKISVDRYNPTVIDELYLQAKNMYDPALNPMIKPAFVKGAFVKFSVEMISEEAKDLLARDQTTKFHDFEAHYRIGSWLFDAGCELLK